MQKKKKITKNMRKAILLTLDNDMGTQVANPSLSFRTRQHEGRHPGCQSAKKENVAMANSCELDINSSIHEATRGKTS